MVEQRLPAPGTRGAVMVISGERRAGKTTLLLAVRQAAIAAGLRTGGVISVARFVEGVKTGIDVLDAGTGQVMPLAHYRPDAATVPGAIATRYYVFDPAGLAAGQRFAEYGRGADLFFADELGPLELERGEGWVGLLRIVEARAFGCGMIVLRPELLEAARDRLGLGADTPVLTVEPATRDALRESLIAWVSRWRR